MNSRTLVVVAYYVLIILAGIFIGGAGMSWHTYGVGGWHKEFLIGAALVLIGWLCAREYVKDKYPNESW